MKRRILAGAMAVAVAIGMSGGVVSFTTFASGTDAKTERISAGTYDENGANGVVIDDSASGHNGFLIIDKDYTIKDTTIKLNTNADGTDTCDFSGKGAAVAVFGNSDVLIDNSTI